MGEKLKTEEETVSQSLLRVAGEYAAVTTIFDNMGLNFGKASLETMEFSDDLIQLAGGLDAFGEKSEFIYQNFFTAAEREAKQRENATQNLAEYNQQFTGLDITSRDAFRAVLDGIDPLTEAGRKQYAALLDIAESVDILWPSAEGAANSIDDLSGAISLYHSEFFTAAEQTATRVSVASAEISSLNLGENVRDSYRTLIESLDVGTEAYNNAIKYAEALPFFNQLVHFSQCITTGFMKVF